MKRSTNLGFLWAISSPFNPWSPTPDNWAGDDIFPLPWPESASLILPGILDELVTLPLLRVH